MSKMLILTLAVAVLAVGIYLFRQYRFNKHLLECRRIQKEEQDKIARDRVAVRQLADRLKETLPTADPNLLVSEIHLDEDGHDIVQRLQLQVPAGPSHLLYDPELKPVECPDFHSYKIPEPEVFEYDMPDGTILLEPEK